MYTSPIVRTIEPTSSILSRATYPGAPSYGGVRTCVESSQAREDCVLAEASYYIDYTFTKIRGGPKLSSLSLMIIPIVRGGAGGRGSENYDRNYHK